MLVRMSDETLFKIDRIKKLRSIISRAHPMDREATVEERSEYKRLLHEFPKTFFKLSDFMTEV